MFLLAIVGFVIGLFVKTWRQATLVVLTLGLISTAWYVAAGLLVIRDGSGNAAQLSAYMTATIAFKWIGAAVGTYAGHTIRRPG